MNPNELSAFRKQLQECQKCFKGAEPKCRHHEDLVGGYDKGKIVFIGINPQGQENNPIYRAIESAAEERRNQLGDEILKMLVDPRVKSKAFADIDFRNHKGLTGWLPRARRLLGLSSEELANRVRFVEAYKHTTANQSELHRLASWAQIEENCPTHWLGPQLKWLEPKLLVFSGKSGRNILAKWGGTTEKGHAISARGPMKPFHGMKARLSRWGRTYQCLITFAISGQSERFWSQCKPESERVRTAINDAWT